MAVIEKRSYDQRVFDVDCSDLLNPSDTITSVTAFASEPDDLTFGAYTINDSPIIYTDGRTVDAGKVVQVLIGGGVVPVRKTHVDYVVRVQMVTSEAPQLEATVIIRVKDVP